MVVVPVSGSSSSSNDTLLGRFTVWGAANGLFQTKWKWIVPPPEAEEEGHNKTRAARFTQDEKNKIPYRPFNPHPSPEL